MSTSLKPAIQAPTSTKGGHTSTSSSPEKSAVARQQFVGAALTMGWQLAVVVLVPVIGGAQLDKALKSGNLWTFIGLGVAFVAAAGVMWRAIQRANRLPVPKLTAEERRKVQKSYEEDDD